jgi:PadR family transcriptional regulator, regulatory protein PadR
MPPMPLPLLQGTLDLLVLGAIRPKPIHGYGIATAIDERSDGQLQVEDAALYQALHRLERQGYVEAEWGASENNRRARYYSLTPKGRRRLADQTAYWRSYARALDGILRDG